MKNGPRVIPRFAFLFVAGAVVAGCGGRAVAPPKDAAEKKTVTFVLTFKNAYASESFSTQIVQEAVREPLEFVGEPVRMNGAVRITTRIPPRADPAGMARRLGSLPGVKTVQVE